MCKMAAVCLIQVLALTCQFLPAAQASPLPKTISLALTEADLCTVLHELGRDAGRALLISPGVSGKVTLQVHRQAPEQVLQALLHSRGLAMEPLGATYWVAPLDELIGRSRQQQTLQQVREAQEPVETVLQALHHASAEDLAKLLDVSASANTSANADAARLLGPRGRVQTDKRTNTLLLTDTAPRIRRLQDWLEVLDRPGRQVLVETRVAAISRSAGKHLGASWQRKGSRVSLAAPLTALGADIASLSYGVLGMDGKTLDIELSALVASGQGEVIATPSVMMVEQQKAWISSGQQLPYLETARSGASTTRFIKAELSLEVTPRITESGQVHLDLELSHDTPGEVEATGARAIQTNRLRTQVSLHDGQTLMLGGIYRSVASQNTSAVPALGRIPGLGFFFRRQIEQRNRQELLIFVTPRLQVPVR